MLIAIINIVFALITIDLDFTWSITPQSSVVTWIRGWVVTIAFLIVISIVTWSCCYVQWFEVTPSTPCWRYLDSKRKDKTQFKFGIKVVTDGRGIYFFTMINIEVLEPVQERHVILEVLKNNPSNSTNFFR